MLDLTLYQKENLAKNAFELLEYNYNQNSQFMNNLEDLQIVDSREIIVELRTIKFNHEKLRIIMEKCEEWYPYCDKREFSEKANSCIRLLNYFSTLCTMADPSTITT